MRTVLSTPQRPCQAEVGEFGGVGKSGDVERARSTRAGALHDVEVDHRRFHTGVAHEILDGADGPSLGPLDVILVGGRLDGQRDEALEESLGGYPISSA